MRSWRPKERLPARRGFGSRTAVHSREGSSGIRGILTPSNQYFPPGAGDRELGCIRFGPALLAPFFPFPAHFIFPTSLFLFLSFSLLHLPCFSLLPSLWRWFFLSSNFQQIDCIKNARNQTTSGARFSLSFSSGRPSQRIENIAKTIPTKG